MDIKSRQQPFKQALEYILITLLENLAMVHKPAIADAKKERKKEKEKRRAPVSSFTIQGCLFEQPFSLTPDVPC